MSLKAFTTVLANEKITSTIVLMLPKELYYWLVLWHAPKMTHHRFHQLLQYFECPENFFKIEEKGWNALGFPEETIQYLKQPDRYLPLIEEDLTWQARAHCHHIIPFHHEHYPALLKETHNPPPLLFVKGTPELLNRPQIAIVGSRMPTPTGIELAQEFSAALTLNGFAITSGLALGIDTAAHQGALSQGGHTFAVLGSCIERIYPHSNKRLSEKIIEKSALISEFPLNTPPKKENFPQRNRIVSGLSLGTLVVEASLRSGSLITARLAAEQGREVFAIPGSIRNSQAQGCHFLIQQGAKLTSNIEHLLEELKGFDYVAHKNKNPFQYRKVGHLLPLEQKVLACLGYEPTPIDLIKARSGLDIVQVANILCDLTLKNEVETRLNGYIKIK